MILKEKTKTLEHILSKPIKCKEDKLLGNGSFGTVLRGFDINNRISMAIKRIHVNVQDGENLKELQKEVDFLKELKHTNIVAYYGSEIRGEFLLIYLEYIDMGSIASMLKIYGPFTQDVVVNYTKQILLGLEYLHGHGVIHRDIKGANILVSGEGIVKLSDFGSAKKLHNSCLSSYIGTTSWMAPEIILDKQYERFADIWSLGCTVFEMLTGKPPFMGKTHYEASLKVINFNEETFQFPPHITSLAKDFIICCLRKSPYKRLNVKKLLEHPFIQSADLNFDQNECDQASQLRFDEDSSQRISKDFQNKTKFKGEDSTTIPQQNKSSYLNNNSQATEKMKEMYNKYSRKNQSIIQFLTT